MRIFPLVVCIILAVLLLAFAAHGKGRILEHYTVHYEKQDFECGTLDINGAHIRFLRGNPSVETSMEEYEPPLGKSHKAWDTIFKILCRKIRGVLP